MNSDPDKEHDGSSEDDEFEASLISDIDPDLTDAETQIVEPAEAPPSRKEETPPARQPPWAGQILGHFKLLRLLGEGKMGRVIQAKDINLHRIVALKILRKRIPWLQDAERVRQFLQEARAAAQIEHPNVVHIYEISQHDGWWYIAMEMLEGDNLRRLVNAAGPLPVHRACQLLSDAAAALAVAHDIGIIHRDIKPSNLMLTRQGRCKVTDFGLVRLDDPNDPFDLKGKIVGSPQYIAPEVITRGRQTPAIDIYSLGATLYYALTGKPPYAGGKLGEILKRHVDAPVPDIRKVLPECSAALATLIRRAMAKDPAKRPTATDFASALRSEVIMWQSEGSGTATFGGSGLVTGRPTAAPAPQPPDEARPGGTLRLAIQGLKPRWAWALAAILGGIAVAAVLLFSFLGPGDKPAPEQRPDIVDFAEYFPAAPETYGVLPPGAIAESVSEAADEPAAFSWVGKVDTTGYRFAASKSGRYFYPIDAPAAALIRIENLVTYKTEAEARADGKIPPP